MEDWRATVLPWLVGGLFTGNLVLALWRGRGEVKRADAREAQSDWELARNRWRSALGKSVPASPWSGEANGRTKDAVTRFDAARAAVVAEERRLDQQLREATDLASKGTVPALRQAAERLDEAPLEALKGLRATLGSCLVQLEDAALAQRRTAADDLPVVQWTGARDAVQRCALPPKLLQDHPLGPEPAAVHEGMDALRGHDPLAYIPAVRALRTQLASWRQAHLRLLAAAVAVHRLSEQAAQLLPTLPPGQPPEDPRRSHKAAVQYEHDGRTALTQGDSDGATRAFERAAEELRDTVALVPVVNKAPVRAPRAVAAMERQVTSQRESLSSVFIELEPKIAETEHGPPLLALTRETQQRSEALLTLAQQAVAEERFVDATRHVRALEAVPTEPLTGLRSLSSDLRALEAMEAEDPRRDKRLDAARTRAERAVSRDDIDVEIDLSVGDALRETSHIAALSAWAMSWTQARIAWRERSLASRLNRARAHRRQAPPEPDAVLPRLGRLPYTER